MNIFKFFRWRPALIISVLLIVLFYAAASRLRLSMDVVESLPNNDPVINDAVFILKNLPVKDRVAIDIFSENADIDTLTEGARALEAILSKSGQFSSVGISSIEKTMPELIFSTLDRLPVLFTKRDLTERVAPLLTREKIFIAMKQNRERLLDLNGIGQSSIIEKDPLGFSGIILARMAHLAPGKGAGIYKGQIISADKKHVLVIAAPSDSGTDTDSARKISSAIKNAEEDLSSGFRSRGINFKLTPVGSYRAALDNENMAKSDTRTTVIVATICIAVLLFLGFPRPYLGLLALVPAIAGTIMATAVYSIFADSITVLAIGFGGAIISFTVDYGIAYLLFLDRTHQTHGLDATKEVWGLGLLAMLTTAFSFACLAFSGFPALKEIGTFAALGVVSTYLFVHAVFPFIFPLVPASKRAAPRVFIKLIDIISSSAIYKVYAAAAFTVFMAFFAKPEFNVDLQKMNSVTKETLAAEKLVTDTWGNVMSRTHILAGGESMASMKKKSDHIIKILEDEKHNGRVESFYMPSMIIPGEDRMKSNMSAWKSFWNRTRIITVKTDLSAACRETGFSMSAFRGFIAMIEQGTATEQINSDNQSELLGVFKTKSGFSELGFVAPGKNFDSKNLRKRLSETSIKIFDPSGFGRRLGSLIFDSFVKMSLIVGVATLLIALLYLADIPLTMVSLAPTAFALICTFGTMKLLNITPGIPAVIVTTVVIGMGSDYAMYLVRAHQRYLDSKDPGLKLIRLTVFLSSASSFIGFGVMCLAEHSLLKNAGATLLLGIGYSIIGAYMIVPPLTARIFAPGKKDASLNNKKSLLSRIKRRYKHLEPYPRLFARFKLMFDPMFPAIGDFAGEGLRVLDIGCGYGVPAAWLCEKFKGLRVWGIEPDPARTRIAAWALGDRGVIINAGAPNIPFGGPFDRIMMLDMVHYLDDESFALTLMRIKLLMAKDALLVMRITVPGAHIHWKRRIENMRNRMSGAKVFYRTAQETSRVLSDCGFGAFSLRESAPRDEEIWITAKSIKKS